MKIIVKNLKQKEYNVEVDSGKNTVKDLKLAIEKAHGFDANQLRLLHNGVVLEDEKSLESYEITDQKVVIMMNAKTKPKVDTTSTLSSNPPQTNPPKEEPPKQATTVNEPNYTEQINSLVDMGYEKSQVEAAIKAAKGSVELAIEFLTSGNIPQQPENVPQQENNNSSSDVSSELKKNASIIKIVCHKEPTKIINILNNIKEKQPDLLNKIKENEEEFKRLLVAPINQEDLENFRAFSQEIRGLQQRPGIEIRFTKEESDAIKRLKALGNFDQSEVIQAFIACDKNEEMAANYLFEQKLREEEENNNANNGNNSGNNNANNGNNDGNNNPGQ